MKIKDMVNVVKNSFDSIYDKINAPFVNSYAYKKSESTTKNYEGNKLIYQERDLKNVIENNTKALAVRLNRIPYISAKYDKNRLTVCYENLEYIIEALVDSHNLYRYINYNSYKKPTYETIDIDGFDRNGRYVDGWVHIHNDNGSVYNEPLYIEAIESCSYLKKCIEKYREVLKLIESEK